MCLRRSDSGTDSESDEDLDLAGPSAKKFSPSEETFKLLKLASAKPLKNDCPRKVIDKLPIPACDTAHPPKLSESISWLIPKSARSFDKYLSKFQRFTIDAMGLIGCGTRCNKVQWTMTVQEALSAPAWSSWVMLQPTLMWREGRLS